MKKVKYVSHQLKKHEKRKICSVPPRKLETRCENNLPIAFPKSRSLEKNIKMVMDGFEPTVHLGARMHAHARGPENEILFADISIIKLHLIAVQVFHQLDESDVTPKLRLDEPPGEDSILVQELFHCNIILL